MENINGQLPTNPCKENEDFFGLTKREYFAGQALQGLTVQAIPGGHNSNSPHNNSYIARHAVAMADALLEELER